MPASTRSVVWSARIGVLTALALQACAGADPDPAPGGHEATPFEAITALQGPSGGGGTGPIAPESTCDPRAATQLSVDAASRRLSWYQCATVGFNDKGTLNSPHEGARELTTSDIDSIAEKVEGLNDGTGDTGCGADAAQTTLDIREHAGTKLYMACPDAAEAAAGRVVAAGVYGVYQELWDLTGQ